MTKEMQTLALAPVGNLESYIRAANTWPMLAADDERELAEKLHYQGDLEAANKLILSHLRFVVHIARELPEILRFIIDCLLAVHGKRLVKITVTVQKSYGTKVHIAVRRLFRCV